MKLKKGKVVSIYEDPITKKRLEGKAVLIEELSFTTEFATWKVSFINNKLEEMIPGEYVERRIYLGK